MSEMSKQLRSDRKERMNRIIKGDPHAKVDASDFTPAEPLMTETKTGNRPVSRRQYRVGGAVAAVNAGRSARKSGGSAGPLSRFNVREAAKDNGEPQHVGGFKRGGHADEKEDKKLIEREMAKHEKGCKCAKCWGGRARAAGGNVSDGRLQGTRPTGGRIARKHGGKAKGKTNIIINIGAAKPAMPPPMPPPGMMPPGGPAGMHMGAPPPRPGMLPSVGAPPPAAMPPGMPGGLPPGMLPRNRGGRAYPIKDGAGGGMGRMQKMRAYGLTPR